MKKFALILGLMTVLFACHEKEPQNQSGINDPTNIYHGDVDSSVLDPKKSGESPVETPAAPDTLTTGTEAACIDSSKIDADAMCTQEFKPVCGCDNVTYPNECEAKKAGVTKWVEGECK